MRAAVRTSAFGGGISFRADEPPPAPAAGQVLLHVMAAGINPVDYKLPKAVAGRVIGLDVAGIVEAVGKSVENVKAGDEVFGFASMGHGSLSDWALCDAQKLAPKPKALSWLAAAALPTAHLTSYQALAVHGKMQPGHSVLVIGASGGCGLAAVQLAKALGASTIVGVCSGANRELVLSQGATRVVDYSSEGEYASLREGGKAFDVVYDAASGSGHGEDYQSDGQRLLKEGGMQVAINGGLGSWLRLAFSLQPKSRKLILTAQNGKQLSAIVELLGETQPVVDSTHPLSAEGVDAAFSRLKSRRAQGKVLFDVAAGRAAGGGPACEER